MMLSKIGSTKKAQSALEFLTTYGWAFLVILIMIGALSYFGVLDPSRFLPEKCIFGAGLGGCQEFSANSAIGANNIVFKVINNLGVAAQVWAGNGTTVAVTGLSTVCPTPTLTLTYFPGTTATAAIAGIPWNTSQLALFNISGCTILAGERPNVAVTLAYTPTGQSYVKTVDGIIAVKRIS